MKTAEPEMLFDAMIVLPADASTDQTDVWKIRKEHPKPIIDKDDCFLDVHQATSKQIDAICNSTGGELISAETTQAPTASHWEP
ncbi:hypothetical protein KKF55_03365 [Patescibacteria group bacterium]|nr:hypothetical protein [Patescibacteria group bacterium]